MTGRDMIIKELENDIVQQCGLEHEYTIDFLSMIERKLPITDIVQAYSTYIKKINMMLCRAED